eukprot:8966995-Pyramimonas_sp.AAC.1
MVDVTARQAHNQLALCERNIGILKDTMTKIAEESDAKVTADEILWEAIAAMSDLGRYKGNSPCEMMLGRTPDAIVGDVFGEEHDLPLLSKTYDADDGECIKNQKVRLEARKAFLE